MDKLQDDIKGQTTDVAETSEAYSQQPKESACNNMQSNKKWLVWIALAIVALIIVLLLPSVESRNNSIDCEETTTLSDSAVINQVKKDLTREEKLEEAIKKIKITSELGTVEYTITIVHTERKQSILGEEASLAIVLKALLKGGIIMKSFSRDNVIINEDSSVTVFLPHAKLISKSIVDTETHTYNKYLLLMKEQGLEGRHQSRIQAEKSLDSYVDKLNIIEDAENNAREFFRSLLGQLGYKSVDVEFMN